ncbi:MAG TPA: TolC family protein [Bryobacteraceae bacterium]|nr:TolC family protein [Bryobacteraceae bacterium]
MRRVLAVLCVCATLRAQAPVVSRPTTPVWWRPYVPSSISSTRMTNSQRIHSLMRTGKLYLTLQDAIALAVENDLNLEVARNGPENAEWALQRATAGGAPRGVSSAQGQIGGADSGLGVLGTAASAGISAGGAGSASNGGGGGVTTSQIGTTAQVMDPFFQNQSSFSHITYPQTNQALSGVDALVAGQRIYNNLIQQGLPTGGFVQLKSYEQYLHENSPGDQFNPAVAPYLQLSTQIPVFQGRGFAVNSRQIKVALNNKTSARETFRAQLESLVSNVVNSYWDLVSDGDTLKSRREALDIAQKFYDDTKGQIELGSMAPVELPRAAAELAARKQDVGIAEATVRQQEALLKDQMTRAPDPEIDAAEIITLDRIDVPAEDNLPPLRDLLVRALAKRPDMAIAKMRDESAALSSLGTRDALSPTGIAYAQAYNRGAAGTPQEVPGHQPNPYFAGGYGTAMGQVFRNNFPSEAGGFYFRAQLGNHQPQADYGVEQLQLKQSDVSSMRDKNAILVEISNEMIALKQARARYVTAVEGLKLQQQLLEAERNRFSFGTGTTSAIIVAQRAVVAAQTTLVSSLSAYVRAKTNLDKALGETLEVNKVSVDEGLDGRVARESKAP